MTTAAGGSTYTGGGGAYRLGRIHGAGDANVYSDIDVCESDGRCAYAKASNQCHREPATA